MKYLLNFNMNRQIFAVIQFFNHSA